jgi:tRNA pseudouridine55 synthase
MLVFRQRLLTSSGSFCEPMFGLLNIDKPPGVTSRDVVNRVQRLARPHKCGHAGTLDPLATGVLVVAIGKATRLIEYVQRMPKIYRGTFLLGRTSDTEDVEGQIVELPPAPIPSEEQLRAVLPQFLGTIEQRPPAFSALNVAGRRAYDLARRGETVELAPRRVEVYELSLLRYQWPEMELLVRCGSGTYIRSLGRDVASSVGTGAVMAALRREAIGPFRIEQALTMNDLSDESIRQGLLPAVTALGDMPRIAVNAEESSRLARGQAIANRWHVAAGEVAALSEEERLVALLSLVQNRLQPNKFFGAEAP